MKKTWALSLALVVTAIVGFACGGGDKATSTTSPTATSPAPTSTSPAMVEPTATTAATSVGGSVTLSISTASSDDLIFASDSLTASAGAEVVLTFNNNAVTQQHNWVLVQDGTKETVAAAGLSFATSDWVSPDDANVIVHSKLTSPGESGQITFTAPAAGIYQFVCTFPGHNLTMFGNFTITP